MKRLLLVLLVVSLVLAACGGGGGEEAAPAGGESSGAVVGDPARGEKLFNQTTIGSAPGCVTCHSLEPGKTLVGPSLADIATVAEKMVEEGKAASVDEFLRESIVNPNAYVTEGFPANVMYQNYGKDLSEQQIADLVAFMKTLK